MGFVEYTKPPRSRTGKPFLSVNKSGIMAISRTVADSFLKDASGVVFLFDSEANLFAFRPVSGDLPNAYRVRRTNNMVQVSAASFFHGVGISLPEKTIRYACEWDDQLGAVVAKTMA